MQARERRDHGLRCDLHARVDHRGVGVDDRGAGQHVAPVDASLRDRPHARQIRPVVDPEHLAGIADLVGQHAALVGADHRQDVGEVQLPLGIVRLDFVDRAQHLARVKGVQPGVHFPHV